MDSPPKPRFRIQRTQRLLVVAVAAALLLLLYGGTLNAYIHQQRQIAQTKQEIEDHRESIASLEEEIDRWNDPEYVKTQARERLGWVLPGETGFRVVGPDGQPYGGGAGINGRNLPDREDNAWWDTMWGSVITADDPEPGTGASVPSSIPSTTSGEPPR